MNEPHSKISQPESNLKCPFKWYHWALVLSIDMLGPFSTDSYIPNMAQLQNDLQTSSLAVGFSLQVNWIVKGVGTLVLGQLSDTHGRRPILLFSFLIYLAGTLSCTVAPSISFFVLARVVQGIGEGSAAISSAIARDVLSDETDRMRMMAILGTLRPLAIIAAPSIGGILGSMFGWRRVFIMLSCWGMFNLTLTFLILPETLRPESVGVQKEGGLCRDLAHGVVRIVDDRQSLGLILSLTLLFSAPACMLSNIAFVLEDYCGLSQSRASLYIGSIPLTMIAASMLVGLVGGKRAQAMTILRVGMFAALCSSGIGYASALSGDYVRNRWIYSMVPFYCMVFSQSLCAPAGMSMYLTPWGADAGLASGLMSLARAIVPSLFAIVATVITTRNGPSGLLVVISTILILTNAVFWPLLGTGDVAGTDHHSSSDPKPAGQGIGLVPTRSAKTKSELGSLGEDEEETGLLEAEEGAPGN